MLNTYISDPPPNFVYLSVAFQIGEHDVNRFGSIGRGTTCVRAQTWREAIDKFTATETKFGYERGDHADHLGEGHTMRSVISMCEGKSGCKAQIILAQSDTSKSIKCELVDVALAEATN